MRVAFGSLLSLPEPAVERALASFWERREGPEPIDRIVHRLIECFPGDVGVLAAMLLNPVELAPGQALFVVDLAPAAVAVIVLEETPGGGPSVRRYPCPAAEFELDVVEVAGQASVTARLRDGPRIVVCLVGLARVGTSHGWTGLAGGESVLIGDTEGPISLSGASTVAIASVPRPGPLLDTHRDHPDAGR